MECKFCKGKLMPAQYTKIVNGIEFQMCPHCGRANKRKIKKE